jgi:hypothetical protein
MVIEALLNHSYKDSLENIYSMPRCKCCCFTVLDCMVGEKELDVINCKFLANEADREKISKQESFDRAHSGAL